MFKQLLVPIDSSDLSSHAMQQGLDLARQLGADSLRYLPVEAIARAIDLPSSQLCQACITGQYPTDRGQELYQIDLKDSGKPNTIRRAYERTRAVATS